MTGPIHDEMLLATRIGLIAGERHTVLTTCAGLSWKSEREGESPLETTHEDRRRELQARVKSLQECIRDLLIQNQELRGALLAARARGWGAGPDCNESAGA